MSKLPRPGGRPVIAALRKAGFEVIRVKGSHHFCTIAPAVVGNESMVLGTVDKKIWQSGLQGSGPQFDEVLKHMRISSRCWT